MPAKMRKNSVAGNEAPLESARPRPVRAARRARAQRRALAQVLFVCATAQLAASSAEPRAAGHDDARHALQAAARSASLAVRDSRRRLNCRLGPVLYARFEDAWRRYLWRAAAAAGCDSGVGGGEGRGGC